ncbi:MAG: hypothetical protein ACXW4J_06040, partial [Candidatus Deferrimicrobiaceae bacterium]
MYHDGFDRPELVLVHYAASPEGSSEDVLVRSTAVVTPSKLPGMREVHLFLPRPGEGVRLSVRYAFSGVGGGTEWFS